jgi:GTP pyrophosphokinase
MSDYVEELLKFNPNYDENILELALETATKMHKDQKRKSGEPYIIHPMAVGKILAELGMDDHCIAAGLLHDAVEDTEYSLEDCKRDFGEDVAVMVDGVTKLTNLEYTSKEEAQAENVRKMFMAMSKDIRVLVIKLADRLHNMRTIEYQTPAKQIEKSKETLEIYAPIASRLGIYKFKFELEDISFRILEPEAYHNIELELQKRNTKRSDQIEDLMKQVEEVIQGLDIKYEITGRRKHYYSIYKKMIYQHKEIDEIFDLTAIRVIVDTVKDCYAVLGAVHTKWTPIPGRFKDYVAMPKSNHYQSLHTTVLSSKGTPFEIQIRTQEIHRVAEYGIAAHWKYKEVSNGQTPETGEEEKLTWLRQILEWQQDMTDNKEFMNLLKNDLDLFSDSVYCFTPT